MKYKNVIFFFFMFVLLMEIIILRLCLYRNQRIEQLIIKKDPSLLFKHKENFMVVWKDKKYITDKEGFRNFRKINVWKSSNTKRIFCLGDSATFGYNITDTNTYSAILEKLLNKKMGEYKWEVINAAIIGATSFQIKKLITEKIIKYKPDYIIISCGVNDQYNILNWSEIGTFKPFSGTHFSKIYCFTENNIIRRFKILRLLKEFFWRIKIGSLYYFNRDKYDYLHTTPVVCKKEYVNNLYESINIANRMKAKCIILPMPSLYIYSRSNIEQERIFFYKIKEMTKSEIGGIKLKLLDYKKLIMLYIYSEYNNYSLLSKKILNYIEKYKYKIYNQYFITSEYLNEYLKYFNKYYINESLFNLMGTLEYQYLLKQVAVKCNLPYLDVRLPYLKYELKKKGGYFLHDKTIDFWHPNEKGHKLIAEYLYNIISQN